MAALLALCPDNARAGKFDKERVRRRPFDGSTSQGTHGSVEIGIAGEGGGVRVGTGQEGAVFLARFDGSLAIHFGKGRKGALGEGGGGVCGGVEGAASSTMVRSSAQYLQTGAV